MVSPEHRDSTFHSIILFDGVCNLCNGFVQFVIRRDKHDVFRFGSLQSEKAQELLKPFGSLGIDLTTIVLLEGNRIATESQAVLKISGKLTGGWSLLYWFSIVPKFIRDSLYRFVSRYRYLFFWTARLLYGSYTGVNEQIHLTYRQRHITRQIPKGSLRDNDAPFMVGNDYIGRSTLPLTRNLLPCATTRDLEGIR